MGSFSHFFIDRPVFASVLSIFIVLIGGLALFTLPLTQYPPIAPPTIVVSTVYPGADAQTVMETVATPLEQEINGVEHLLYMSSNSGDDGSLNLTVTFTPGTDADMAQVLVQNRVALAEAKLPEEVRRQGVSVRKRSPDLSLVINLLSPDGRYDSEYLSNYALTQIKDVLARQPGVGEVAIFGARDYSLRLWLDPEKLAAYELAPMDVVRAVREQNVEVAAGAVGKPPLTSQVDHQYTLITQGRLKTPEEFGAIVVKTGPQGQIVHLKDIARVELGARDYASKFYLDGEPSVGIAIFQLPGSNALETKKAVMTQMEQLKERFPPGLDYTLGYDTVVFVEESLKAVGRTLIEAFLLVALVVWLFLQNWRASLIPLLAVPVSVIGTLAVMAAVGASLNTLSLLSLVLAIGIVVDDAIVVVENVERHLASGEEAREATRRAMDEVTGPILATSLVLIAVFVPTAFIAGVSQAFYREFAITVTASTAISTLNSLTLSPALCAKLLGETTLTPRSHLFTWFFSAFNHAFGALREGYLFLLQRVLRASLTMLILYLGLVALGFGLFRAVPKGFLPEQDQGYLVLTARLPPGASLERTAQVVQEITHQALATPGVGHVVAYAGWSFLTGVQQPYAASLFARLKPFAQRPHLPAAAIAEELRQRLNRIAAAEVAVFTPPPIRGLGRVGGFKLEVQDRAGLGPEALKAAVEELIAAANREPGFSVFSPSVATVPRLYLEVDRIRAKALAINLNDLFATVQVYLGSLYVNDFNLFGRTYQVLAQADAPFRRHPEDVLRLKMRSATGAMVPLGSLIKIRETQGSDILSRYNLYLAAEVNGSVLPGISSGEAIAKMERLAEQVLPPEFGFEWTELSLQEVLAGHTALFVFPLSVMFVFLVLAAQYESWSLPFSVILIAPLCLTTAMASVWLRGYENNLFTQIGCILLVGLAAKNAILLVEFARVRQSQGQDLRLAVLEAARIRLRPILMTSLTFILGVVPLALAQGAGAEARRILGTAVCGGMLGVTFFGLMLTPVFYALVRRTSVKTERF
ncbi:MAG: efflux RND transporter permease subunit [Methylohalobius sp.]|nr:efflux RND transporter permease subunit [Methylohalobius sp.]